MSRGSTRQNDGVTSRGRPEENEGEQQRREGDEEEEDEEQEDSDAVLFSCRLDNAKAITTILSCLSHGTRKDQQAQCEVISSLQMVNGCVVL